MPLSRRTALIAASSAWAFLVPAAFAAPSKVRVRSPLDSPDGQAMLSKYKTAVKTMRATTTKESSAQSWLFQWYTHALPKDKQAELDRVFGLGSSPLKSVAARVWGTCQAHVPAADPNMFLPWHRMYLLAFEEVVRAVLADDEFALPYWDYTDPKKRSIPTAFRTASASPDGSLFIANRNQQPDINKGEPMDKGSFGDPFNLNILKRPRYGGPTGFCQGLDDGIHSNVHGSIGDGRNMGSVATAARDPIFWLHHCNIDRLWAAWNAAGGVNEMGSASFAFASPMAGEVTEWKASSVGDTVALGYQYLDLPTPPAGPVSGATAGGPPRTIAVSPPHISLGPQGTRVALRSPSGSGEISASVASASTSGRIFLLLKGLMASIEPGTLYEVFVALPENASNSAKRERYLGTFSFFGASGEHAHQGDKGPSFEITEQLSALRARNLLGTDLDVTILPVGTPRPGTEAMIGSITVEKQ